MYRFDAGKVKSDVVKWIRDWFEVNGKGCKAVIGISGGKDSSVVAALCVEALGKENVFGVLMPNGEQFDIDVSLKLVEHLGTTMTLIFGNFFLITAQASIPFSSRAVQTSINIKSTPPRMQKSSVSAAFGMIPARV